jgi:hypothetical protein
LPLQNGSKIGFRRHCWLLCENCQSKNSWQAGAGGTQKKQDGACFTFSYLEPARTSTVNLQEISWISSYPSTISDSFLSSYLLVCLVIIQCFWLDCLLRWSLRIWTSRKKGRF